MFVCFKKTSERNTTEEKSSKLKIPGLKTRFKSIYKRNTKEKKKKERLAADPATATVNATSTASVIVPFHQSYVPSAPVDIPRPSFYKRKKTRYDSDDDLEYMEFVYESVEEQQRSASCTTTADTRTSEAVVAPVTMANVPRIRANELGTHYKILEGVCNLRCCEVSMYETRRQQSSDYTSSEESSSDESDESDTSTSASSTE